MRKANSRLVSSWRNAVLRKPPYLLPGDELLLEPKFKNKTVFHKNFKEYIRCRQFGGSEKELQVGLLPVPYVGDLKSADIFILMLNPGFGPLDVYAESHDQGYRKGLLSNLAQKNLDPNFPFMFLNPIFSWGGGFQYWNDRLKTLARALENKFLFSYPKALEILAHRIACLQLVPYHSKSFDECGLVLKLRSSNLIVEYANEMLLPRARRGELLIVVVRGAKWWGLSEGGNIVIYRGHEARGANLSVKSRGGVAMLKWIFKKPLRAE